MNILIQTHVTLGHDHAHDVTTRKEFNRTSLWYTHVTASAGFGYAPLKYEGAVRVYIESYGFGLGPNMNGTARCLTEFPQCSRREGTQYYKTRLLSTATINGGGAIKTVAMARYSFGL
jgi:hypothetical protein